MDEEKTTPHLSQNGTLKQPPDADARQALRQWQWLESGMDGPRGGLPDKPDDPVAYRLLDTAGEALERGETRQGVAILRLLVKEYRYSQEAACARRVIDQLAKQAGHGR